MKRSFPAVVLALLLSACPGDDPSGSSTTTPTPTPMRPRSTATVMIVEPELGAVVPAGRLTVRVRLTGGRILEEASRTLRPDTGHIHLKLDGKVVTQLAGLTYEIENVAAGTHSLEAEFAAADHFPFDPPVKWTVQFTAR